MSSSTSSHIKRLDLCFVFFMLRVVEMMLSSPYISLGARSSCDRHSIFVFVRCV